MVASGGGLKMDKFLKLIKLSKDDTTFSRFVVEVLWFVAFYLIGMLVLAIGNKSPTACILGIPFLIAAGVCLLHIVILPFKCLFDVSEKLSEIRDILKESLQNDKEHKEFARLTAVMIKKYTNA